MHFLVGFCLINQHRAEYSFEEEINRIIINKNVLKMITCSVTQDSAAKSTASSQEEGFGFESWPGI